MIQVIPAHVLGPNALANALRFARAGSGTDADKVGWIPLAALRQGVVERRLHICYNNDDHVGYCFWQQRYDELKIYQIWVRQDARMILHGRALVDALEAEPRQRAARLVRLWCAEDLAANVFWEAIGFTKKGWRHSPHRTATRRHLLWVRPVTLPYGRGHSATLSKPHLWQPPSTLQHPNLQDSVANGTACQSHPTTPSLGTL